MRRPTPISTFLAFLKNSLRKRQYYFYVSRQPRLQEHADKPKTNFKHPTEPKPTMTAFQKAKQKKEITNQSIKRPSQKKVTRDLLYPVEKKKWTKTKLLCWRN